MRTHLALLIVVSALSACSSEPKPAEPDARARAARPARSDIEYGIGFYEEERNSNGQWRWIGPDARVVLKNTHQPMLLAIRGLIPARLVKDQTLTIQFNGATLDTIHGVDGVIEREYTISPEQQTTRDRSDLTFHASHSYVPKNIDPATGDGRVLSFTLYSLAWTAK